MLLLLLLLLPFLSLLLLLLSLTASGRLSQPSYISGKEPAFNQSFKSLFLGGDGNLLSNIRKGAAATPAAAADQSHSGYPPPSLDSETGGLESSGQILISSNGKTKRIAIFSAKQIFSKKKLKKGDFFFSE